MLLGCFDGELPMLLGRNAKGSSGFWKTWKAVEDGSIGGIVSVGGGFSPAPPPTGGGIVAGRDG